MEKSTPVRKQHTSTADLLMWSEMPPPSPSPTSSAVRRSHKPSGGISPVLFGGQMTRDRERQQKETLLWFQERTGNDIFAADNENGTSDSGRSFTNPNNRTSVRICQQTMSSISQISFSAVENVSPKKPVLLPEVAKQCELSGTLESESDAKVKKQLSDAKCKELSGHDIFGPPPENPPRPLAAQNLELKACWGGLATSC